MDETPTVLIPALPEKEEHTEDGLDWERGYEMEE